MRKFYVVLSTSFDYDREVTDVVAWTENPYVAISYFKEYQEVDSDANMITISCNTHLELIQIFNEEYNTDMEVGLNTHLTTITSKNERCYVIYKERYHSLFTSDFIHNHTSFICDYICRIMISTAPLIRYINPEYNDVISNLLFIVYTYTSIKKMIRHGLSTDLENTVDLVYFWKLVTYNNPNQLVTSDSEILNPTAVVFIDSGYRR